MRLLIHKNNDKVILVIERENRKMNKRRMMREELNLLHVFKSVIPCLMHILKNLKH